MANEQNSYLQHGCKNREEYLEQLAEEYDVDISIIMALAELLGPNEDFDGLINAIEEI